LVWSRGGGTLDLKADIQYLTNHYSQLPYIGDEAPFGSARAHSAFFLPLNGTSTLVVDVPWWRRDLVVSDDVVESIDVPEAAADAVRGSGVQGGRLALVGLSYMSASAYLSLTRALPDVNFVHAHRLVEDFRIHKSDSEIELIRQACALGTETMETLMAGMVPGGTEAEAVAEAGRVLTMGGGLLWDAACVTGSDSHHAWYSRLPSADAVRPLEAGDLFHIDLYGAYGGYLFDFGRSGVVGDSPTEAQLALLETPISAVEMLTELVRPNITARELHATAHEWLSSSELGPRLKTHFPAFGHGIGLMWEPPWLLADDETVLEPNMYLALDLFLRDDALGGAYFEDDGLVTADGFEVLTLARTRPWRP
jgi:Xaa-Pro aminopeptidase